MARAVAPSISQRKLAAQLTSPEGKGDVRSTNLLGKVVARSTNHAERADAPSINLQEGVAARSTSLTLPAQLTSRAGRVAAQLICRKASDAATELEHARTLFTRFMRVVTNHSM
jgi:hypothetical protein